MPYRIDSVTPGNNASIELGQITVLVGPNNCGKSQTLKDIRQYTSTGRREGLVVLESLRVTLPSEAELKAEVQIRPHQAADHIQIIGVKDDLQSHTNFGPNKHWFSHVYPPEPDAASQELQILRSLGTCLIGYLGAEARFKLTESSPAFNPRSETPSNALQSLYASDLSVMTEFRRAFRDAFEMDIGLDWAAMTRFYLRVANDFGQLPDSRIELDLLMANAEELQSQGDGFRSFAGIAMALLTYPSRVILLDEPEAFLHPAQARVLGRWVATQAARRPGQVVVATHSADFLAGMVSAGVDATILRLNRINGVTKFHRIPKAATTGLIESPLLSSQPVLDSLFHRGVVICEGDPDRAVYQTVAHRFNDNYRGEDFLFIHSNGKDAARFPAKLLRDSGTPVCVVADFDVISSESTLDGIVEGLTGKGLDERTKQLRTVVADAVEAGSQGQLLEGLVANVKAWLERNDVDLRGARRSLVACARGGSNKWDQAKKSGFSALPTQDQGSAQELIGRLSATGLFVVPCGELESWLENGASKGSRWNQRALQALHDNECPVPLKAFVEQILSFLAPRRT
ncbi:ATP-dependent nuclease [Agrilutibacter solisilvae]|uniref:AAA family ATPase n=1 Tax=Agrilutibacter solisilvae TaxID=2763317 RepID=A0A974XZM6_9GAMM|nr:AAA family ATPase [Lysobacter solisilvae]QSX78722.1 AAA family ATPase [Lysobacter solisilvae]